MGQTCSSLENVTHSFQRIFSEKEEELQFTNQDYELIKQVKKEQDNMFENDYYVLKEKEGTKMYFGIMGKLQHEDFITLGRQSQERFSKDGEEKERLCRYIVGIEEIFVKYPGMSCNGDNETVVKILMEYMPQNLEKVMVERRKGGKGWKESEVIYLLERLLECLQVVYQEFHQYSDLQPSSILISPLGQLKLIHSFFVKQGSNPYSRVLFREGQSKSVYLSPAQLKNLELGKVRPIHDPQKSDLFCLGMIALECALNCSVQDIYHLQSFSIKQNTLNDYLVQLDRQRYHLGTQNLIKSLLVMDETGRLSLATLLMQVQELRHQVKVAQQLHLDTNQPREDGYTTSLNFQIREQQVSASLYKSKFYKAPLSMTNGQGGPTKQDQDFQHMMEQSNRILVRHQL